MPTSIPQLYADGLPGSTFNQAASDDLWAFVQASGGMLNGGDVAQRFGFADKYKGELVLSYIWAQHLFPGCFPGPPQARGDCVSHGAKNCALVGMSADIVSETPDPESGKIEVAPEVSLAGIRGGVLSTCPIYWHAGNGNGKNARGDYRDDGWYFEAAAKVLLNKCGAVPCGPIEGTNEDLTKYTGDLAGKYANGIPPQIANLIDDHTFRTATQVTSYEQERDFHGKGFGVGTDGSEGFSSKRDANGVCDRKGSWAHSMMSGGTDDRDSTKQIYGGGLTLVAQSWGPRANSGPRDIRDSTSYVPPHLKDRWIEAGIVNAGTGNIMIPEGWFWVRAKDWSRRRKMVIAGCRGWEIKNLPNLRGGFV